MFDIFRRHQKKWMAALAIMAMFAFSFPASRCMSLQARPEDQPVAKLFGREITPGELKMAENSRAIANNFLLRCLAVVGSPLSFQPSEYVIEAVGFGKPSEESLLEAMMLDHKAEQLGIVINDELVNRWIKEVTGGKLTSEQFRTVVRQLGVNEDTLYNILRQQLRIRRVAELALGYPGPAQVTPYETWQFYRKLNDELTFSAIAVPVSQFTDKVQDPGDAVLRELYAKYVDRLPEPSSPQPGFKEPRKVELEYAQASLDQFLASLKPEVTEEAIRQEYEKNKEMYRILSDEEQQESEQPDEDQDEGKKRSQAERGRADQESADRAETTDKQPTKPATKARDDQQKEPPSPASSTSGQERPAGNEPGQATQKTKQTGADQERPASKQPPEQPPEPKRPEKKPEPKYRPLAAVRGEIRDRLARQIARQELLARLRKVSDAVYDYGTEVYAAAKDEFEQARQQSKGEPPVFQPPTPPDFAKLIKKLGFSYACTGLVPLASVSKLPELGKARELVGQDTAGQPVAELVASDEEYDPRQFWNTESDTFFVLWKRREQAEREPRFEEIRDQVLAAYRAIQARELAEKQAQHYATALREAKGDLARFQKQHPEAKPIVSVDNPIPLWSTAPELSGSPFAPPEVVPTEIPGIAFPGDQFRQAVFALKEGEVTVAANLPRDHYYVVVLHKRKPASLEAFARSRFITQRQLQVIKYRRASWQWRQRLRREAGFQRLRPAGN